MKKGTKEIAQQIKKTREKLGISIEEISAQTKINKYQYEDYESGEIDIPVSAILSIAECFKIDISVLLTGEKPTDIGYSVTKKGDGVSVERHHRYKYQALAHNFANKIGKPFIITIDAGDEEVHFNNHAGQEFIYILKGHVTIHFKDEVIELFEGDNVYFDANIPHAIRTENGERSRCLAVVF